MHLHALVERGQEEVVLVLVPDPPPMGEPVEIDLIVGRFLAETLSLLHVFGHSHSSSFAGAPIR